MEAFIALAAVVVAMLGFDALALRWGADSRPKLADDHRR
jgi:hypothetical protein